MGKVAVIMTEIVESKDDIVRKCTVRKIEFVKTYIMNFMAGVKHLHDVSKELPKMYLFPALLDSSWWKFEKYKVELFAQWLFDNLSVISNKLSVHALCPQH